MDASNARTNAVSNAAEPDLVITRIFDAPRRLVFEAWTKAEHLMRWFGPKGSTTRFNKVDFRVGGVMHYCMRSDGRDYWGLGVFREIVPPSLIVYTDAFADSEGNPVPPAHYGMSPGFPEETLVTVTFEEQNGSTKLTLRQGIPETVTERDGTQQGWNELFDRLAEVLEQG
jgi:uncharacterized protein YndB with AHSA1/START domain